MSIIEFLELRITDDEAAARACAEMFPSPWDVADRGWRVRIYASDVPVEDFSSDVEGAMTVRNPVVIDVEPDRHIEDPQWLSERVAHIARHDPARVLADCAARRAIIERLGEAMAFPLGAVIARDVLRHMALPYADHPDFDSAWDFS